MSYVCENCNATTSDPEAYLAVCKRSGCGFRRGRFHYDSTRDRSGYEAPRPTFRALFFWLIHSVGAMLLGFWLFNDPSAPGYDNNGRGIGAALALVGTPGTIVFGLWVLIRVFGDKDTD